MTVGIMGVETLTKSFDRIIPHDEPLLLSGYIFSHNNRDSNITENGDVVFEEMVEITHPNGKKQVITATINHLSKFGSLHAAPAISLGFLQDIQLVMKEVPSSQESTAEFRITFFPLMSWIWAGGGLMAVGGIISLVNGKKTK